MGSFNISNRTPVPTITGGYQSDTGTQFASDFKFNLNKEWTTLELWWDATAKWPKIVSKTTSDCMMLFEGNSTPNAIINNDVLLSPYSEIVTDNAVDSEFWFNTNMRSAPSYTPTIDSVIAAQSKLDINYFDANANLTVFFYIDMELCLITSNPAFPVDPKSYIKFRVECWEVA